MKIKCSRMSFLDKSGFTLIELLVVVLIIGILAAVALPQYNKAVEKSRVAEAIAVLNTLRKGVDLYVLEQGYPTSGYISILGESSDADANVSLDLTLDNALICTEDSAHNAYCYSKDFAYSGTCYSTGCSIGADRISGFKHTNHDYESADLAGGRYTIYASKSVSTGQWEYACVENSDRGLNMCAMLESLGWK